jgi:DNA-binding FadR family transcriptional regulator
VSRSQAAQDPSTSGAPPFSVVDKGVPVFVQIADQLLRAIEMGELAVGARLPSEANLSKQFGVSRVSVREALSSLQFAGYLESRRGAGTLVRSRVAYGAGKLQKSGLTHPTDIVDLFEARLAVEPKAVGMAALDPVPSALRQLETLLEGMQLAVGRPQLHAHTDIGIHLALARACKNPFLAQVSTELLLATEGPLWRSIRDRTWETGELPLEWLGHHESIVKAVTEGESRKAKLAVQTHLLSVLDNVVRFTPVSPEDRRRVGLLHQRYGPNIGESSELPPA